MGTRKMISSFPTVGIVGKIKFYLIFAPKILQLSDLGTSYV